MWRTYKRCRRHLPDADWTADQGYQVPAHTPTLNHEILPLYYTIKQLKPNGLVELILIILCAHVPSTTT